MRILEVSYALTSGGGERMTVDLCNQYAKNRGDEVWLLMLLSDKIKCNTHYLPDLDKRVKVYCAQSSSGLALKSFYGIIKAIRKIKPDVVHAHICDESLLFLPALLFPKVKFVSTFHTTVSRSVKIKALKSVYHWMFRTGKITACTISPLCKQSYIDYFHSDDSILVINGRGRLKATDSFDAVKRKIASFKKSNDEPVFVYVGRANPVKNPELLYNTFKRLEENNIAFQLFILGSGHDPIYKQYASDRIHIEGEKTNVGDYLLCADFMPLTSHVEGLPLVLLEAMSCGVIPVCTPAGGVVDVVRHRDNGFVSCDTEDTEAYYNLVVEAISCKDSISKKKLIEEYNCKYSIEVCARQYYDIYCGKGERYEKSDV